MGRPRRSAVKKYHDRVAARYDQTYDDPFWKWHDSLTWDYLKPFLPVDASARVIDLGCGTGKWGAKIAKSGFAVTFVDISHKMIDQARRQMSVLSTADRFQFLQADICDLSALPPNEYSLGVALGDPIGSTHSPAKALKQIHRILCPGGVLVATFDNRLGGIDYYLSRGDPATMSRFLRDGRTHWLTNDSSERFPIFTYTPTGVADLVGSAGYDILE